MSTGLKVPTNYSNSLFTNHIKLMLSHNPSLVYYSHFCQLTLFYIEWASQKRTGSWDCKYIKDWQGFEYSQGISARKQVMKEIENIKKYSEQWYSKIS